MLWNRIKETMKYLQLINPFRILLKPPVQTIPEIEKEIERKIVSRLSRGNISLQTGRYVTKQDITDRYNKIKNHRFI